jgi:hypothetical protein
MTGAQLHNLFNLIDNCEAAKDVEDALKECLIFAQSTSTVDDPFVKIRLRELTERVQTILKGGK